MNVYQHFARERQARRFSTGDGVIVADGPHKGRPGFVMACGRTTGTSSRNETQRDYSVCFTDAQCEGATLRSPQLLSDPKGNTGKYGGPSRGGAAEGWRGTSRYRVRR